MCGLCAPESRHLHRCTQHNYIGSCAADNRDRSEHRDRNRDNHCNGHNHEWRRSRTQTRRSRLKQWYCATRSDASCRHSRDDGDIHAHGKWKYVYHRGDGPAGHICHRAAHVSCWQQWRSAPGNRPGAYAYRRPDNRIWFRQRFRLRKQSPIRRIWRKQQRLRG
jgi:hypothetical protein